MCRIVGNARIRDTKARRIVSVHRETVRAQILSPSLSKTDTITAVAVQQRPPVRLSTQRPPFSPSRRPLLRVTIPGTEHFMPWLSGRLYDSPLVCFTRAPNSHAFHRYTPSQVLAPKFRPHLFFSTQMPSAPILIVYTVHTRSYLCPSPLNKPILNPRFTSLYRPNW